MSVNDEEKRVMPRVPDLDSIADLDEDALLTLTRKVRLRQVHYDLEANGGVMPQDPEEKKIMLSMLKDLDSQALKQKMIGAKKAGNAAEALAASAVLRMLQISGNDPYRRTAPQVIEGEPARARPSIKDAVALEPLQLVRGETAVEISAISIDEMMGSESPAEE